MRDPRVVRHREEDLARWRSAGLLGARTIGDELHAVAERFGDLLAVTSEEGSLGYRELDVQSDRIAAGLHALGLRPGDPVLFQVGNRLGLVPTWYGVLKAGLRPVATLAPHRQHEIGHISRAVGAVAHIVESSPEGNAKFDLVAFALQQQGGHPTMRTVLSLGDDGRVPRVDTLGADVPEAEARALVAGIQAGIDPSDVAVFQLSGGTTGVPKLIPRFHLEYWYNGRAYAENLGWDTSARVAHVLPLVHNAGISCSLHAAHSVGACLVLGSVDLPASMPFLAAAGITDALIGHGHFLPAQKHLAQARGTLKRVILSGAKIPRELFDTFHDLGLWVGQLFGMGEGFFAVSRLDAPEEARRTTVGTAMSAYDEMKILEPGTETPVPDGEVGELCCRGPYTLVGYFDAADHNRTAFTSDGFYRTGDLGRILDFDGHRSLSIEGRIKDTINRGGEKINAEEVEVLLCKHPAVLMAAVVAMPDPRLGERACAFLVPRAEPVPLEGIQQHLAALGVAKFKWPERLEWRADLPRSNVNKIDKKGLRAEIAAAVAEGR